MPSVIPFLAHNNANSRSIPQTVLVVSLTPMWVKLADFGVSKLERNPNLRTIIGTRNYSSLEILHFCEDDLNLVKDIPTPWLCRPWAVWSMRC